MTVFLHGVAQRKLASRVTVFLYGVAQWRLASFVTASVVTGAANSKILQASPALVIALMRVAQVTGCSPPLASHVRMMARLML